jgi:hypothetical protein
MESIVSFEDRGWYVRCEFRGPFELEALLALTHAVRSYCVEHGHRRVLVDVTASQGTLGALERYEHAVRMAKSGELGLRAVILARPDQLLPDRFWETASRNRGLAIRVVTDTENALAWLESEEP